jgi:hypothetical protein
MKKTKLINFLKVGVILSVLGFADGGLAKTITINLINETQLPLNYIVQGVAIHSQESLPDSVPIQGFGKNNRVSGLIYTEDLLSTAQGFFKVGYDASHYCEFYYTLQYQAHQWNWFMRPINWVGMNRISCAVDPDAHKSIVFQKLG